MDPNITLHELRELCGEAMESGAYQRPGLARELAEKFDALDGWMSKGGFAPDAWRETRDHR